MRRGLAAVCCALALTACATSNGRVPPSAHAPPAADPQDPLPHTPRPQRAGAAGGTVALSASGGRAQARQLAHDFIRALLDADSATLTELFEPAVVRVRNPKRLPRETLVGRCLQYARQLQWHPDLSIDEAVVLSELRVTQLSEQQPDRAPPPGLRPHDMVVVIPIRGRDARARLDSSPCLSQIYVRPGAHPTIVGVRR